MALVVPAAFFAALDGSNSSVQSADGTTASGTQAISDSIRGDFLRMGRGFAVILLIMCVLKLFQRNLLSLMCNILESYISSRFYMHDPPGKHNAFQPRPDIPRYVLEKEKE